MFTIIFNFEKKINFFPFLRVDELSSDSYIGRDDFILVFFSEKVFKFVQAHKYLSFDLFLSSVQLLF